MDLLAQSVLLISIALWIGYIGGLYVSSRKAKRLKKRLAKEFSVANALLQDLCAQTAILEDHSQEYFYTLFNAQLPKLQKMISAVTLSIEIAQELRSQGELENALGMVCWILGSRNSCENCYELAPEQVECMENWRIRAREILAECVQALEEAHQANAEAGIERKRRSRRSTDMDIKRLRTGLLLD